MIPRASGRIRSLDSLRGIAALAVLVLHLVTVLYGAQLGWLSWLFGRVPVMTFFALSGYVLALPYFSGRAPPPSTFLVRRFCRVYLPYLAVTLTAAAALLLLGPNPAAALDWPTSLEPGMLRDALLATGTFRGFELNPPSWSLVIEMRYSLIFPLLVAGVALTPRWVAVASMALLGTVAWVVRPLPLPLGADTFAWSLVVTAAYAPVFAGGVFLARYRDAVERFLKPRLLAGWLFVAVAIALSRFNAMAMIAGIGLVALVRVSPDAWAHVRPIAWLGRVSYSIYLWQAPVLIALQHVVNPLLTVAIGLPAVLIVAEYSYVFIEAPSIALGRRYRSASEGIAA